jgi:transcriptional regulator with XRE-family HTH domain
MGQLRNQVLINAIAARIKQIRESKGITQEVFVYDTNINIGRIEAGQINVSVSTLEAICRYFGISLKAFFAEGFDEVQ